ncbi:MAG: phytanoyl-CoA dioxygenase family protein [Boseongicola sp.]|nr:phytanoyl-CoA dioxygenase family protein [Boseongicola sp.]MYH58166.1 phytanoyl-CoA dioxygenase [Boseongicola sp. SB0675_bin_26]
MDDETMSADLRGRVWLDEEAGSFGRFCTEVSEATELADWPKAEAVERNVPVYEGSRVRAAAADSALAIDFMSEWNAVLDSGPGIIVIRGGMANTGIVDEATEIFERIIDDEQASGTGGGDHFARPGANDRVWNAAQKHCQASPANFLRYYASDAIALAARAWLGRGYQLTAQVNRVNPGGAAQTAHRDYHLGFMNADQLATYPIQAHELSPHLTLQGAIAHCDMPVESGPTMLLPYSQRFTEGYVAFGRKEFQEFFAKAHVQLPLEKGDLLFFNPAVMHAAGTNRSRDIRRMANLLQIGSAFGRSIEAVNRSAMSVALYPVMAEARASGSLTWREVQNAIAASAEGYSFPTNLDRDPPVGGLIPRSQAELMEAALEHGASASDWEAEVAAMDQRRMP